MTEVLNLEQLITNLHEGDKEQLSFIFSEDKRIIVEAPAGYGKTKTMISKIAYQIASNNIPSPKKILALTFSVNAAYKIKKDVTEQIPIILNSNKENKFQISEKIIVSNYHGLCRRILKRYGHRLHSNLRNLDIFTTFDDGSSKSFKEFEISLDFDSIAFLNQFSQELKNANSAFLRQNFQKYNDLILAEVIPHNLIPFNALLSLTISLLKSHKNIQQFYQKFFPCIYIDEFQDTNLFSFGLIQQLINTETKLFFMGDSLQRIYGFIGAMPNLINTAKEKFDMKYLTLSKNYRFKDNPQMLLLDYNIRRNAESLITPAIKEDAKIDLNILPNQDAEAKHIFDLYSSLIQGSESGKVAILFRGGGGNKNTIRIIQEFDNKGITYFYGLFSDEDVPYRKYHLEAALHFSKILGEKHFSRRLCRKLLTHLKSTYSNKNPLYDSLLILTEIFLNRMFYNYHFLTEEEKVILVKETFESFGLKQFMEYVDSKLVFSTIHGAKGLEWNYVIMPDVEQFSLPNWYGTCKDCEFKKDCVVKYDTNNESLYLDELSVFYVGFTRARKQVFFTASSEAITSNGRLQKRNLSCFLKLKGISIN